MRIITTLCLLPAIKVRAEWTFGLVIVWCLSLKNWYSQKIDACFFNSFLRIFFFCPSVHCGCCRKLLMLLIIWAFSELVFSLIWSALFISLTLIFVSLLSAYFYGAYHLKIQLLLFFKSSLFSVSSRRWLKLASQMITQ